MPRRKGAGRPQKINDEVVAQMKNYIIAGLTLKDACSLLEITYTTWNNYEKKHPDILRKRKAWQGMLKAQAQANIARVVMNDKDPKMSVWVLNREEMLEAKRASNELVRARAKAERVKAKLAEQQLEQATRVSNNVQNAMDNMTEEELLGLLNKLELEVNSSDGDK